MPHSHRASSLRSRRVSPRRRSLKQPSLGARVRAHHVYRKVAVFVLLVAFSTFVHTFSTNLRTDVIGTPTAAPFNGTVPPLEKVPAWTELSTEEWSATYDAIPTSKFVAFPKYDITNLQTPVSDLTWGDAADDAIRNAKITFPVVYIGNYEGDFQENAGSHPAIDIKAPQGTPVRAIANGVVETASYSSGGFGYHIVIRHDDAPDPDAPNNRIVLYSSYSHLSDINISEGDVVTKGQMIGLIGHTGTATTNHLHFQIDRDSASFHPYWPFTSADMTAAGLGFFDAINAGLGKDNAQTNTINPLSYVQQFEDDTGVASSTVTVESTTTTTETIPNTTNDTESTVNTTDSSTITTVVTDSTITTTTTSTTTEDTSEPEKLPDNARFVFLHDGSFTPDVAEEITIAVKEGDQFVTDFTPHGKVKLTFGRGEGSLDRTTLSGNDFVNGQATIILTGTGEDSIQIKATLGDMNGVTVLESGIFSDVINGDPYYDAVKKLKEDGVVNGYPDGTFKPTQSVSRVEALKFIFTGAEVSLQTSDSTALKFPDTDPKGWYAPYVQTAQMMKIVKGYPDGTFKPVNSVNRVEFLKMLFASANIDVSKLVVQKNPFPDVDKEAWYAPYVVYAKQKGLIDPDVDQFAPSGAMTRGEVAQVLYLFRKKFK